MSYLKGYSYLKLEGYQKSYKMVKSFLLKNAILNITNMHINWFGLPKTKSLKQTNVQR